MKKKKNPCRKLLLPKKSGEVVVEQINKRKIVLSLVKNKVFKISNKAKNSDIKMYFTL